MKILSWDVGIKNLAFCLINSINEEWSIDDWGIINLIEEKNNKCFQCKRKPFFYIPSTGKKICKIHSRKYEFIPIEFNQYFNSIDKSKCQHKIKDHFCNKNAKFNKEFSICKIHAKQYYNNYIKNNKLTKIKKKNASEQSIDILRIKLIQELEKRKNLLTANLVLIENQPTLKNPKMKAISSTIYDYFLIRGIFDKLITKSNIDIVRYISPSNKLKIADNTDTIKLIKLKGQEAKTYKLTKSLGIKYCKKLLENHNNWIDFLNSYKKKDDLADAFLQGMYYHFNCKQN